MKQDPILILDNVEDSSCLKIEYIGEDSAYNEFNGESVFHIYHVRMITEHLLRELRESGGKLGADLSEEEISAISIASSLHDIGKNQIPKSILDSPRVLSPLEYDIVKKHSILGERAIREASVGEVDPKIVEYAAEIARWHHERIDGLGYPDGLCGSDIPLCAQVVAMADAYDALTSARSYKKAFTQDVALQMIANGNCGAFDKKLVKCLRRVVKHSALVSYSESLKRKLSIVSNYDEFKLNHVLLVGNTEYLDKDFVKRTFPQSKVTIIGDAGISNSGQTKLFRPRVASVQKILETYEFDLIVFFAEGLSFRSAEKSDSEELRRLLKYSSNLQKNAKILYLSPLDAAFESDIDRAIAASANEKLCEFYANKHSLNTKVIRIPYLYSSACKKDFLHNMFEQLCAHKTVTIPEAALSKMHFLSVTDLSDLIVRIVDDWKIGSGILTVGDEFKLTFADLAKKITELDGDAKIDFTDSDCSGTLTLDDSDLRNEYGWYAKISLVDDLNDQYESFLGVKQKKSVFAKISDWFTRHSLVIKIFELFALFAVSELLIRLTNSAIIFSIVDFRTIFVVIMATIYGTSFGLSAAFLSSISYFFARIESGTNALTIFYEPTNWLAFVLYFLVGGLCGYIHLKNKDHCKTVEDQSRFMQDKLTFVTELYEETLQDKKALKKQIISSKDSFGKILDITKNLNSTLPQQLYLKIVETFENVLKNKSIAVYLINPNTPFARLQVASRDMLDTVSRSIVLDNYAPVIEKLENGEIWKNTELNLDYPAYAYGVYREGELVLIIFLWHANIDQRTLYYVNLFKILCDLAQMSLLRAYDYSIAMYEKQYIPNTHIMNSQYFEECFENYLALSAKKVMSFVILEIDVNGHTLEEVDKMVSGKIRTTDVIGLNSEGKLRIILSQASHDDLKYILPRFENIDVNVEEIII